MTMKKSLIFVLVMMFITLAVCSDNLAGACSVMMKTNSQGTFVGRTLEWWGPVQSRIAIIPRGFTDHDIGNNMSWTVKYGTIAIEDDQVYCYSGEGINEKGLTAHLLTQSDSIMPKLAANKATLNSMSWVKYVLANYGNVNEVIASLQNYQIKPMEGTYQGQHITNPLHFAVHDASGDAAVIEFNGGKLQVFHGPQYNVMTNEPAYIEQLANLVKIKSEKKQYSVEQLPGGSNAANRFVRISFNMENMPEPKDATQAVVYMEQAICNILVPTFDEKKNPKSPLSDAWEARWRVVYDLKNMNMYFDQDESGKKVYMKITNIDFSGKVIRYIDPIDLRSEYNM
jgi:penicillin V acylase-like amidase (Ntn superfamily)